MEIIESRNNGILIIKVNGRLDSNTYNHLSQKMDSLSRETKIVFDLSDLDYISSAGLRVVLMQAKKAKKMNGDFRLCNMKSFIKEIFDITGFSKILNIDSTLEISIAEINK